MVQVSVQISNLQFAFQFFWVLKQNKFLCCQYYTPFNLSHMAWGYFYVYSCLQFDSLSCFLLFITSAVANFNTFVLLSELRSFRLSSGSAQIWWHVLVCPLHQKPGWHQCWTYCPCQRCIVLYYSVMLYSCSCLPSASHMYHHLFFKPAHNLACTPASFA